MGENKYPRDLTMAINMVANHWNQINNPSVKKNNNYKKKEHENNYN